MTMSEPQTDLPYQNQTRTKPPIDYQRPPDHLSSGPTTRSPYLFGEATAPWRDVYDRMNAVTDVAGLLGAGQIEPFYDSQRTEAQLEALGRGTLLEDQRRALMAGNQAAQGQLGLRRAGIDIDRGAANRTLSMIARLFGLNEEALANRLGGVNLAETRQNQAFSDDATARGAFTAPGTRREFTAIEREAELARQAADINFRETEEALKNRRGTAQDTLKRLDLESKRLGLSAAELQASLDEGLARLGMSHLTNSADLIRRLSSIDAEEQTMAANLLNQALGIVQSGAYPVGSSAPGSGTSAPGSGTVGRVPSGLTQFPGFTSGAGNIGGETVAAGGDAIDEITRRVLERTG